MNSSAAVGPPWAEYASLQQQVDQVQKVGHRAWAIEDQANAFLDSLAQGSFPADTESRQKWLDNLRGNRQRKHRNRSMLLQEHAATAYCDSPETVMIDQLAQADNVRRVRTLTSAQEWRVLDSLANGGDYRTLAEAEHMSFAALRTRVSRCRQRLRAALAA